MKNKKMVKLLLTAFLTISVAISAFPVQTTFCASDIPAVLPDAGGRGRIIIYIVGSLIVFAAVVGLLWTSWKNKNDKDR